MTYENNKGGEFGKNYVQELHEPPGLIGPEFREVYDKFAKRILWMDGNVCPGAIQMNTAWYFAVPERDPIFPEHEHAQAELIGFYSSDSNNPYDLGATIEFAIGGENHRLTKSSLLYIPAGVKHGPMRILEVKRPVFHFSVVVNAEYDAEAIYK